MHIIFPLGGSTGDSRGRGPWLNQTQLFGRDLGAAGGLVGHDGGAGRIIHPAPLRDFRQGALTAEAIAALAIDGADLDAGCDNGTGRCVHRASFAVRRI